MVINEFREIWYSLKGSPLSWILLIIALLIVAFLCTLTMHELFKRLKECYFKKWNFNLWLPSIILGALVVPYRLPFSVIIIHFSIIFLIFDLIEKLLRKITGKELKFLYSGVLSLIISSTICIYGLLNFLIVVPNQYIIESDKLDREYTVVFISDIHGPIIPMDLFKKYIREINEVNADIILLGGDITDEFTKRKKMEETYRALGEIDNKDGIYYVYGNHDRLKYAFKIDYNKNVLDKTINENGINILNDSHVVIDNQITIIGRDDTGPINNNRMSVNQLLSEVDPRTFVIMLEHEPSDYDDIAKPEVDLYLCGHTHAGQIFPIGFYFQTFWDAFEAGRFKYKNLDIIISSGFGSWATPFRTERHSEYVVIKIIPQKQ